MDVQCKYHDFSSADNFTISGDLRVKGLYMSHPVSPSAVGGIDIPRPVEFKSGSASGATLLTLYLIIPTWYQPDPFVNVPGDGVRFPDGLYVASPQFGAGPSNVIETMTLIYQGSA